MVFVFFAEISAESIRYLLSREESQITGYRKSRLLGARCYVTERAAIARMGAWSGARTVHMNSLVLTEMDYCATCGSLFNKKYDRRSLQRCAANVISLCKCTASKCTQNRLTEPRR